MNVFTFGRPTKPDVELLLKQFPEMQAGDKVSYEAVAEVIKEEPKSSRFRTVTDAWRKRQSREFNVELGVIPNERFEVLDPHQRVDFVSRRHKSGVRRIVKAGSVASRTERKELTFEESKACDHFVRVSASIAEVHNKSARELRVELKAGLPEQR